MKLTQDICCLTEQQSTYPTFISIGNSMSGFCCDLCGMTCFIIGHVIAGVEYKKRKRKAWQDAQKRAREDTTRDKASIVVGSRSCCHKYLNELTGASRHGKAKVLHISMNTRRAKSWQIANKLFRQLGSLSVVEELRIGKVGIAGGLIKDVMFGCNFTLCLPTSTFHAFCSAAVESSSPLKRLVISHSIFTRKERLLGTSWAPFLLWSRWKLFTAVRRV